MIGSLAAIGLAPGLGSTSQNSGGVPIEEDGETPDEIASPVGLPQFEAPERTVDTSKSYEAVVMTDQGEFVIALNPEAPEAVNSFAFLAGQNFYDGLEFFWVLPGFDAQTGDPTCQEGFPCTGTGGPGYDLPRESDATEVGQWSVVTPVTRPGGNRVHGSQLVIALDDAEIGGTVIGEVVTGQEVLQGLSERVPCFGAEPSESNPCQPQDELPEALTIEDVLVRPA